MLISLNLYHEQINWLIFSLGFKLMGNTKSEKASNCEQHERLGEVKLIEGTDLEGNLVEEMIVTKMVESEQQFNLWLKSMNKIDDSMTREVLLLPSKSTYESTGMCGSSGVVHVTISQFSSSTIITPMFFKCK